MERKCVGAHNVQVLGLMCGAQEVPHCQGRTFPIQKHVPICKSLEKKI